MVFRIQRFVPDAAFVKQATQPLGAFDGNGAHQARLANRITLGNMVGNGVELSIDRAVHLVVAVVANNRLVGRNGRDFQLVNLAEL